MTIDRSSWWWRQGRALATIFATLLAAGIVLNPLQSRAWAITRANQPGLNLKGLGDNLGQGTLLGVFGGFRDLLADFAFLRQTIYWEQRDRPNTEAMLDLATTLDPRMVMFWTEGASEIAYDIPAWFGDDKPPPKTEAEKKLYAQEYTKFYHDQAELGLEFLDRGLQFLPGNYELLKNKAMIYQNRLKDEPGAIKQAAETWRLAAEATTQVYFPMRQYLYRLWGLGDKADKLEAYDYLRKRYPALPENIPDAQKSVMWDMLQAMEQNLQIPEADRAHYAKPANYSKDPDFTPLPGLTPDSP